MCGIAGKYYFDETRKVDSRTLQRMTDIMSHRGPDDRGFYYGSGIGLGHRRLSIMDLSPAGHQPMCNENGTVWVAFNGEIYNYKELRAKLEAKGHLFRSATDTEVIVHAYEEYAMDCIKDFNGMFAFAIWDEDKRRLFVARDHFGIKPLYYYACPRFVGFASEIKALLQDEEIHKGVDEQALSNFLSLHYVPAPRTMFAGIRKLPPGHFLVAERGTVCEHKYWELQKQEVMLPHEDEVAENLYSQLKSSVAQRLQSDVPVGTLLSGGVDSSAMLGLMTEISGPGVPAFSVGYSSDGRDGFSEFHYSRIAAKYFGSDYHEVVVTPEMFLDFLPRAVWHQDEPIGEPASIPLFYVCKFAKEHGVTVLLSGEGSDELFAGYNRYLGETLARYYRLVPSPLHKSLDMLLSALPQRAGLRKGHRSMLIRDFWKRYQSWHTVFSKDSKQQLLGSNGHLTDSFVDSFARYDSWSLPSNDLDKVLWLDLKVWLPDDLLMKKDRMGMATSVEARVPFLDHRFAEMAFSLPSTLKVRRLIGKYVFKKSMRKLLPDEIIYRKKAGFPTPIGRWMAQELRGPITAILCESGQKDHGYFDRGIISRLLKEHVSGRANHERLLFPILNFDLWYREFFSGASKPQQELFTAPVPA
jgi:asparagine synthase (glutamine-hydrolysing)